MLTDFSAAPSKLAAIAVIVTFTVSFGAILVLNVAIFVPDIVLVEVEPFTVYSILLTFKPSGIVSVKLISSASTVPSFFIVNKYFIVFLQPNYRTSLKTLLQR